MLELLTEVWLELGAVWALRVIAPPVISPETAAVIRRDFTVFFVMCDSFSIEIWDRFRGTDRASESCRVPSSWGIGLLVSEEVTFFRQNNAGLRQL